MKDKSRFISSVIVSLLAGFIYYQFGQGIQENFEGSIKAILSYNDMEEYIPVDCQSFNSVVKKSGSKINKKSKFYIKKKNTIEFKTKDVTIPGDELFSDFVSNNQAKFKRPIPDKNIDFTAELEHLIKNDLSSDLKPGKEFKVSKSLNNSSDEVATREYKWKTERLNKSYEELQKYYRSEYYTGNGFEYNHMSGGSSNGYNNNSVNSKNRSKSSCTSQMKKNECTKYKVECNTKSNATNEKKTKIIAPKVHVKVNDESVDIDIDSELEEINVPDEETNDGTM